MKISKQQLRQIIKEEASRIPSGRAISPEQAEEYLRSKADSYRRQGVTGKSMEMLLMDDFMDDLGHQHDVEDYEGYIRELVLGESAMKITKSQLKRIIKEEKAKLQEADYEYDPVDEIYAALQDLTDAQLKLEEVASFLEKSPRPQDKNRVQALFNLANQVKKTMHVVGSQADGCLLYTSPSPRDKRQSRMPSSA